MEWDDAVRASPDSEAWRIMQEGQRMYVDGEGIVSIDDRPYYTLSHEIDDSPWDFDDWRPIGLGAEELRDRIHDIIDPEIKCGFLSPTGIFYQCEYHEHQLLAESIAHHLVDGVKEKTSSNYYAHAEDDIVRAGWAVLKFSHSEAWWVWPDKWTQKQVDAAWDRQMATGDEMPYNLEEEM